VHSKSDESGSSSRLSFRGTVLGTSGRTADVRVDEVPDDARAKLLRPGLSVQVQLAPGESVSAGERAVFDIGGWELGETLVLHSLGHTPTSGRSSRSRAGSRKRERPEPQADLVVRGEVTRVGPAEPSSAPLSEHDPEWQEAVVRVDATDEGPPPGGEVVVRFPASTDVRWHRAPKLAVGQRGTFELQRGATASASPVFTLLYVRS
jgi:hypothetical protein